MTATASTSGELCRLTVFGPDGRADLAVPVSIPVAALLPVFLRHTVNRDDLDTHLSRSGSWVLQRLGEPPLDPDGTPETLDWLEGEQLYLRPATDPLPELDFDDLADGIATVVRTRRDRWRPEFGRALFLALSGVVAAVLALVLLAPGPTAAQAGGAAGVGVVFGLGAVAAGRGRVEYPALTALATLAGLACCVFAGLAGMVAADGVPAVAAATPAGLLVGAGVVAAAAAALLVCGGTIAPGLPFAPFVTVLLADAALGASLWLRLGFALSAAQSAGVVAAVFLGLTVFAPKIVLRLAHMRGPQLPRDADDLQYDIEAEPARRVRDRTVTADRYLSAGAVAAALVCTAAFPTLLADAGWGGPVLVPVLASAVLLRARTFASAWQRVPLTVAGTAGLALTVLAVAAALPPQWRGVLLFGLLGLLYPLVQAALRPAGRRPLPIWGHLADLADTTTAIAVLPVLLQLLGVYGWARGLGG
ncbi:type VII secretion integral membrane protein EccD [Actinophytocola sp.]|uniref:type VII secretion integral membrane protein EccD n=1 Tax=Actinophytocola sp. TaxID=1872138 RepID=UPI002D7466C6|nr:type VII secretion integral membrane protein EccD [Actinophytocola sp.]HYQ63786.1 type VII secretion integral membrane protein EccD [Actinophytocola sp.]